MARSRGRFKRSGYFGSMNYYADRIYHSRLSQAGISTPRGLGKKLTNASGQVTVRSHVSKGKPVKGYTRRLANLQSGVRQ